MKKHHYLLVSGLLLSGIAMAGTKNTQSFNDQWKFFYGEAPGAEQIDFNDNRWRKLDLPHDWAIEGPFDEKHNARCGGLPYTGTGWYRKDFTLPAGTENKVVNVIFDGAMNDAHVWVNGEFVGNRPYGYISFNYDISKYLKHDGSENVIAVRLNPKDLSSRWYPGAGIYRNVWLSIDEPVHIPTWGTFVSTPSVTKDKATVETETEVKNTSNKEEKVTLKYKVYSPDKELIVENSSEVIVPAGETGLASTWMDVMEPQRWDINTPYLYNLVTQIYVDGHMTDESETPFGIRSARFDTKGFYLNGRRVQLNGVCLHHDNGPLGSAVYERADERKLEIMKSMGVNAIRTSHNPQSPEFLSLCDKLGLVVLDEVFDGWKMNKTENDYGLHFDQWSDIDMTSVIRRDRNHPSVIMWSVGNEILEQHDKVNGYRMAKHLADICRKEDPSRPSTIGFNYFPAPYINNMANQLDVVGMNYKPVLYGSMRQDHPDMILYGSETSSCTSSRGVYHLPIEKYQTHPSLQVTSYDLIGPPWAYPPDIEFYYQEQNPDILGEFIWTGFDYLGEPTPYGGKDNSTNGYWNGHWPSRSSYFGAVDLVGLPKDRFFLYQSQWSQEPMIHMLPHWNWEGMEDENIPVYVYTNCDEAELFLNGKSLGTRVKGKDLTPLKVEFNHYPDTIFNSPYRLSWDVPYKKGKIEVVGYKNGRAILHKEISTAGKPARVTLTPDRTEITADGKDLSYVTVRIEDKDGNLCPNADNLVNFKVSGAGELLAVGNGNAATTESFQAPHRKAFSGMCMAIIKSDKEQGQITITATSKGLKSASTKITTL